MAVEAEKPSEASSGAPSFDEVIVPHLGAALRLARWLLRNDQDAEDVVQEAALRACRYFGTFNGGNARAWFLRIVRNTCWGWRDGSVESSTEPFEEEHHSGHGPSAPDPEALLLQIDDVTLVFRALGRLPERVQQMLVLREIEELSYRELAAAIGVPIGTVMSRLSRARDALREVLDEISHEHDGSGNTRTSTEIS